MWLVAAILGLQATALAATIQVNSTVDVLDPNDGQCTLREAIIAANNDASSGNAQGECAGGDDQSDTIVLPAGTFARSIPGTKEDLALTGDLDILEDLSISGAGMDATMVSGGGYDRVFEIGSVAQVLVSDLTITGGFLSFYDEWRNGDSIDVFSGGGALNYGTLNLARVSITSNGGYEVQGTGIANRGGVLRLDGSIVRNNHGGQDGSCGIDGGHSTITNSAIVGNSPMGGLCYTGGRLTNTTISGNWRYGIYGYVNLISCTVTNNGYKGVSYPPVGCVNSILAGNGIQSGLGDGECTSLDYNLVGCSAPGGATGPCIPPEQVFTVVLAPLADNGGGTPTHALLPGSPAIEQGDPAGCRDADGNLLVTDQRGSPRPQDGDNDGASVCDIGAFEAVVCVDADDDNYCTPFDCDDGSAQVYPGAPQLCDGANNDCSDPEWPNVPASETDADADEVRVCAGDCDDQFASTYPGAPELCDGLDNDCDAALLPGESDADADGWLACAGDCDDLSVAVHPAALEVCNSVDDDCDTFVDEDEQGVDTDSDGVHNLCDNCRNLYNPTQLDTDQDLVGNSCDNCVVVPNPEQADLDADARGDVCDNCRLDHNPQQDDFDGDRAGDACDNCLFDWNPTQTDFDHDVEGDLCDVDDGLIYILFHEPQYVEWQDELGFSSWNLYRGDLQVLRTGGPYTQAPGSNALAARQCGLTSPWALDTDPLPGQAAFYLTTGIAGSIEIGLGADSAGAPRLNLNPCP